MPEANAEIVTVPGIDAGRIAAMALIASIA